MAKAVLFFFFSLLYGFVFSQQKAIIPMAALCSPVLINTDSGSSGSGVLICDSNYVYLITAKHVLYQIDTNNLIISKKFK
ncbi:MAG TPA: hypothetical protein VFL70_04855, partial [Bacteroidia bacterium]|nr:hypothetical protein [Bacteroidia bacterium]